MFVVTGASGFLGRAVVSELLARRLPVVAVSRGQRVFDKSVQNLQVDRYSSLRPVSGDAVLLHLAEPNHIASADREDAAHSTEMREAVTDLMDAGWAHVIYASSGVVYGDGSGTPHHASEPVHPLGAYARSKVACEGIVVEGGGGAARLANLYGPGMAANNVMSDILAQLGGQGPLRVRNAVPERDYLWIADAAGGLVDAATAKLPGAFNLGSGVGTSVGALASLILALAGEVRPIEETAPGGRPSRLVLDIEDTISQLGWRPTVCLKDGLSRLVGVPA